MTPDSVHLLTRSSQMILFRDEQGRVRRAYYGPRLREPEDALESAADAPLLYSALADSVTGLPNASDEYWMTTGKKPSSMGKTLPTPCGWKFMFAPTGNRTPSFNGR